LTAKVQSLPAGGAGGAGTPPTPGGTTPPATIKTPTGQHTRYDFVILFFWKEPIPSDKLRFPGGIAETDTAKPPPVPNTPAPLTTAPPSGGKTGGGGEDSDLKRGF